MDKRRISLFSLREGERERKRERERERESRPESLLKSRTFSIDFQLEIITELLGTPTLEDMRFACEGARSHMLRRAPKPPSLTALYTLSSQATHEAVHLLCQMLVFDPVSFTILDGRVNVRINNENWKISCKKKKNGKNKERKSYSKI